jgi:hypothetical protein
MKGIKKLAKDMADSNVESLIIPEMKKDFKVFRLNLITNYKNR